MTLLSSMQVSSLFNVSRELNRPSAHFQNSIASFGLDASVTATGYELYFDSVYIYAF